MKSAREEDCSSWTSKPVHRGPRELRAGDGDLEVGGDPLV